jgi:hypothetical protein
VAETEKVGLAVDRRNGIPIPPSVSELVALRHYAQSGSMPDTYATAVELRGKHPAASQRLSNHLSHRRC